MCCVRLCLTGHFDGFYGFIFGRWLCWTHTHFEIEFTVIPDPFLGQYLFYFCCFLVRWKFANVFFSVLSQQAGKRESIELISISSASDIRHHEPMVIRESCDSSIVRFAVIYFCANSWKTTLTIGPRLQSVYEHYINLEPNPRSIELNVEMEMLCKRTALGI